MKPLMLALLLSINCCLVVVARELLVGSVARPGSPWISSGRTFAFGFIAADDHLPSKGQSFNLAIWYHVDPNRTVVWTAMINGQPLLVSKNAKVELEAENGLSVTDRGSSASVWQTNPACFCARGALLLDSGNLVVLGDNRQVSWQSFDSPTTTLLPEQQLRTRGAGTYATLISRSGAYQLLLNSGQVLLKNIRQELAGRYWFLANSELNSTRTCLDDETGEQLSSAVCQPDPSLRFPAVLNLSSQGVMSFYDATGKSWAAQDSALDWNQADVLRRLTLDDDGNLRIYSFNPTNSNSLWIIVWQAVLRGCDIFGACGPFGLCTYRPRQTCSCPPGFHRVDPKDDSKGCDYNIPLKACQSSPSSGVKLVQMNRADYYFNDYNFDTSINSLQQCKNTCLQDCKCLAAAYRYDGSGLCYLKGATDKLYNGRQKFDNLNLLFLKISSLETATDDQHDPFVTDSNATLSDQVMEETNKRTVYLSRHLHLIVKAVAIAELVIFAAGGVAVAAVWKRASRKKWEEITEEMEGLPTRFSYKQLRNATHNFSDELGSGGFGSVYRGNIPEKGGVVAVKVIAGENLALAEKQFKAEVTTLGRVQHVNLVRLLGYCAERDHRLLVYEFMPNSSLDKHLFTSSSGSEIRESFSRWTMRYSIALGVAKAIAYLHEKCGDCIVHCDIKPQNVLLDSSLSPKLADFGLARLMRKESMSITTVRGTRGYLAPEWTESQSITAKADIYSFGMLLLDLLSGRRKNSVTLAAAAAAAGSECYFPVCAFHSCTSSEVKAIADPELVMVDWKQFEVAVKIALWCVQLDPGSRPAMSRVVKMLQGNVEVQPPPFPDIPQINSTF